MTPRPCSIEGCPLPHYGKGYCRLHYDRVRAQGDPFTLGVRKPGDPVARFWSRVDKSGPGGCWLWTGGVRPNGYGQFFLIDNGKKRNASPHRFSYELAKGPIPDGLVIDHLCRVKRCVNPDHLEAVTDRTNILRGVAPPAINARRTRCINGHPLAGDNLLIQQGKRQCRECVRRKLREYQRRLRASKRAVVTPVGGTRMVLDVPSHDGTLAEGDA